MRFTRDRFTWLAYLMLAYFSYVMAALGPLMPFLRAELNLSYTVAGLHVTAFALGMTLAGALSDWLADRFGRARLFWGGGLGMAAGALLLIVASHPAATIFGAFLMGLLGSAMMIMIQALLADRYGALRSIAFSESNLMASLSTACVPLVIGYGESSGAGWRVAMGIGIAAWVLLAFGYRRQPLPLKREAMENQPNNKAPLPFTFWMYWLVIFFSVSVEWCIGFWGADFLENGVGVERVAASTLMSVFLGAMATGRFIGSRLTRRIDASRLLVFASIVLLIGFPLFWLSSSPLLNVVGLFIVGLGIANLYPLTLSITTSVVEPERTNTASARSSLGAGLAILIMPQILGGIADQVGISGAFGIAAGLTLVVLMLTVVARRSRRATALAA